MPPIVPIDEIHYTSAELDGPLFQSLRNMDQFLDFVDDVNQDIVVINQYIQAFNDATTTEEKKSRLKTLDQERQRMNERYPLDCISHCEMYQQHIHERLWNTIHPEQIVLARPSITSKTHASDVISAMTHEKLTQIMQIFWENDNIIPKLQACYSINEQGGVAFRKIFNKNTITVIAGRGNSRVIKLTPYPPDGTPPLVFKIDARLGQPKEPEQHLRNQSFQHLSPVYGQERQATFMIGENRITANVLLTNFYSHKDLGFDMTQTHANKTPHANITSSALHYYQQMGNILLDMQTKGVAFPDTKNTNWLIDSKGNLVIADTKSFLFCDASTSLIDYQSEQNRWIKLIVSKTHTPQEFGQLGSTPISADKMHTYMLGKNLYQYLTHCSQEFLLNWPIPYRTAATQHSFSDSDFSHAIFNTLEGQQLKDLIQHMVQPDPNERISLGTALEALKHISDHPSVTFCNYKKNITDIKQSTSKDSLNADGTVEQAATRSTHGNEPF